MNSKLTSETKALLERYFDAASNLYGIIPLNKLLKIYNSQNEPISEDDFLSFVDEIDLDHKFYFIVSEDEYYEDVDATTPINRDLVAEYILIDEDIDDAEFYYKIKENQYGKPYYVPDKEKLLKYEDESYHEKTLSFISLRAFFRNQSNLTKETADSLTESVYVCANVYEGSIDEVIKLLDFMDYNLTEAALREFVPLYTDMYNDTRLHYNCGYTPNEMLKLY